MRSALRLASLIALPLALAACRGEQKAAPQGGTAQGEILPGSASDAMLPYDTVRSQPPLAPPPTDAPRGRASRAAPDAPDSEPDEGPGDPPTEEPAPPPAAAE